LPVERGFAVEAQIFTDNPPAMEFDFGVVQFGYGWLFPKRDHVNIGVSLRVAGGRVGLLQRR
jgi:flavin-dependent dehydrogenase